MTRNKLEEAQRVEVVCDGCGRVFHSATVENLGPDVDLNVYQVPDGLLSKLNNGLEYCPDCLPHHQKRIEEENNSKNARHLRLRETIGDPEELEAKLKELEDESSQESQSAV